MSQMRIWADPQKTRRVPYAKTYITPVGGSSPLASRVCDAGGSTSWDELCPKANTPYVVSVDAQGYQAYAEPHPNVFQDLDLVLVPAAPVLEQRNRDFYRDGQRIVLAGTDGFLDYRYWLNGDAATIEDRMDEYESLGFDVVRVFLMGDIRENLCFTLYPQNEPQFFDQLVPFVETFNSRSLIPLLTVFVDNQRVALPPTHWTKVNDALKGHGLYYLMSGGNEADKNGFDPQLLADPGPGVFWSRGSKTQDQYAMPNGATAVELHPVRGFDRALMDTTASPIYMRDHGCEHQTPWMDEGIPFDQDGERGADTNPQHAWQLARGYSVLWAVAVFHNRQGQKGELMKPGTRECASAWVEGCQL